MSSYKDYSYLSAYYLTDSEMAGANLLTFEEYEPVVESNWITWDNNAYFGTSQKYALLDDLFVFSAIEGATYDIYSHSYFDPFILMAYDDEGVIIATDDGSGSYGSDHIEFVADETGIFYLSASWDQGSYNDYVSISVYEDIDTATVTISEPEPEPEVVSTVEEDENQTDETTDTTEESGPELFPSIEADSTFDIELLFDWAEQTYSTLLSEEQESIDFFGYHARMYTNGNAIGEQDGNIYFYDGGEGGSNTIQLVGTAEAFWDLATA